MAKVGRSHSSGMSQWATTERVVIYVIWGKDVNVDIYFSHYIHGLWLVWMTLIDSEEIASVWRIYLTAAKTGRC